ncbi:MAG: hypothetical protein HQ567_24065 [Candidatus Nealsonbacteria bacterium]|nr:hypothetical protein [Candidatus Nealsonbacteria bacterium]
MMKRFLTAGAFLLSIVLIGCNGSPKSGPSSGPTLETHQLADLPALGDPLPMLLDNDRIQVTPPRQWHIASRSSKCLTRFQLARESNYPTIILTAEEYAGDIFDVTEENVVEFAKERTGAKMTPTPIKVGPFTGISYRRRGSVKGEFKNIPVERLMLETVAFGRLYTVELRAREGDETEFRPHLLAVAGGLKFYNPEEDEPDQPEPDADDAVEQPDDSPGEKEKDEPEVKPEDEEEGKPEDELE